MLRIIAMLAMLVPSLSSLADDLIVRISAAQNALRLQEQIAGCGKEVVPCNEENFKNANTLLAISCIKNPSEFTYVNLSQNKVRSGEYRFTRGRPNGVASRFLVTRPRGCVVLAARRAVHNVQTREVEEVVYTPYSLGIDTKQMREMGIDYLFSVVLQAQSELAESRVPSAAFPGLPVAIGAPSWAAVEFALVEHIDPKRMRHESMKNLMGEVAVVIAANGTGAYRYAISRRKAFGLFQFIQPTYKNLLEKYPTAELEQDFIEGTEDHVNAAKAALLLFDSDVEDLSIKEKDSFLKENKYWVEYLAATYNGGSNRARKAMRVNGALSLNKLFRETQWYIKKLRRLERVLPRREDTQY